jgi:hypothetical protein
MRKSEYLKRKKHDLLKRLKIHEHDTNSHIYHKKLSIYLTEYRI